MTRPPMPPDESSRQQSLDRLGVLDSPPEPEFDALVRAAALVCGVPIALVSLIDRDRQWFKANLGLPGVEETPREFAFCAHAILSDGVLEVRDAQRDPRFADNPLVTGDPSIRFYAGATLSLDDGARVGTLCVIDRVPRELDDTQREILRQLSLAASALLRSSARERARASSEMRFRALSDASPLGIFSTDAAGACTYANDRWQDIFGLAEADARGDGWAQAIHPDDRASVFAEWQRTATLHEDFRLEYRIQRGDATVRHVRSFAKPLVDGNGAVASHVGCVQDVTDEVEAYREREEQRSRLEGIIEGTGAGTWEWNVQTGEVRINPRWAEIIGMTPEALSPITIATWREHAHPEDLARSGELLEAHFAGRTDRYECEARMRHRDGHWVWVLDRGKVLTRTADGRPEWMFGTHLDITQRKAMEDRLRRSEELLGRTGALAQVGGWEVDVASGEIVWSEQTRRIHGVGPDYRPVLAEAISFYAPEARPVIEAAVAKAMVDGVGWDLELPFIQRGGQAIWVRAVGSVEFVDGAPSRLYGAFQDITQRVLARRSLEAAQQRVALATDSGGIGIWEWDLGADALEWDLQMHALHGLTPTDRIARRDDWMRLVHPDDRARMEAAARQALAAGEGFTSEFRVIRPSGELRHLSISVRILQAADGRPRGMLGSCLDVTPLRQLANELAERHELLRVTLQSIGDAVITTDAEAIVTWLNPAAERMTGWSQVDATGKPLAQVFHIVHEDTREVAESPVAVCLERCEKAGLADRTVLVSRTGEEFGVEDSAAPIRNGEGDVLGAVLVFHDVTEQRRLSGEMSYRASHDELTGLVNRSEFDLRLRRALDRAHEERSEHALLYIDLDQFKLVNDSCGHSAGDQLLQQVAKLMGGTIRARDTLARLGGDEFAVLLEYCNSEQASRVAQQVCDQLEGFRFVHDEQRFRIGASIGLVPLDSRWASASAAMQAADAACYAAKRGGRNRVHAWVDTDQILRDRHGETQWATRLDGALDGDQFVLHAQRIDVLDGQHGGVHAEVLVRLLDADGGLVLPGAFLPAAERFHMATRIDRWVLGRVIDYVRGLPDLAMLETLCVNLSGQSVGDRAFHRHALEVLAGAGREVCRRLCLEITETTAVTNMADAAVFIDKVRALGVKVALDDFGAGASSFGYLKTLKVDLIKIDGSFIRDVMDDPLDDVAVRCFVDVARVVGVKTVAEFVDRPEVLKRVRDVGVDYAQGFFLHKPAPIEDLLRAPDA